MGKTAKISAKGSELNFKLTKSWWGGSSQSFVWSRGNSQQSTKWPRLLQTLTTWRHLPQTTFYSSRQRLPFHQDSLTRMTYMLAAGGDRFSICQTCFGKAGLNNIFLNFRKGRNGPTSDAISPQETSWSYWMNQHLETPGWLEKLQRPSWTKRDSFVVFGSRPRLDFWTGRLTLQHSVYTMDSMLILSDGEDHSYSKTVCEEERRSP